MTSRTKNYTHYAHSTLVANASRDKHVQEIIDSNPSEEGVTEYFNKPEIRALTDRYKATILKRLNKLHPEIATNIKFKSSKRQNIKNFDTRAIKLLLTHSIQFLVKLKDEKINEIKSITRGKIESVVAIALAYCTNLRTNELLTLTVLDLWKILNTQQVSIRIKKREQRTVVAALSVYKKMYPYIIYALAESYDMIDFTERVRFKTKLEYTNFLEAPQESVIATWKAFTVCKTTINSEIRSAYILLNENLPKFTLGLKSIRKLNTTALLDLGEAQMAAFFNRHANTSTAETYYNESDPTQAFKNFTTDAEIRNVLD